MSLDMGYGSSKSKSTSNSYGYNLAESADKSQSSSQSTGFSRGTQTMAFEDLYAQLYKGASGSAATALLGAPELTQAARQLFTGGSQFLQSLSGGAGTDYMESRLSEENPLLQDQIDALREDTGRLFTEQFNPEITSRAVAGGTLGGSRQGVAQGLAMDSLTREFTRGATELRANDIRAKDAIAANIANNTVAAASTGLGALPGLLDLMERGNNAELGTYAALSSILGGPTVLSESEAQDQSTSMSVAEAFAKSFGQQTSSSLAYGSSKNWNFGASIIGL